MDPIEPGMQKELVVLILDFFKGSDRVPATTPMVGR